MNAPMTRTPGRADACRAPRPDRARPRLAAAALCLLLAAGCKSIPPSTPLIGSKETSVTGKIRATPNVNADARGRPSPVVVRVYELAGRNAFDTVDFVSLYEREKEVLGPDFIAREEITLQPGETRDWKKKLAPQTRFVAVLAAYRDIERAGWRAIAPIKPVAVNHLDLQADDLAIKLVPGAR